MGLTIESLVVGPLANNVYLLTSESEAAVVDPAMGAGGILKFLAQRKANVTKILLTHGHGDHIGAVGEIKTAYPEAQFCCPEDDEEMLHNPEANLSAVFGLAITAPPADVLLTAPTEVTLGDTLWQVLDTSGHSPGGVTYYCAEHAVALTGDTLVRGGVGRTGFPGSNEGRMLRNIRQTLMALPDETRVLPGHGPETTIGVERQTNAALLGLW